MSLQAFVLSKVEAFKGLLKYVGNSLDSFFTSYYSLLNIVVLS